MQILAGIPDDSVRIVVKREIVVIGDDRNFMAVHRGEERLEIQRTLRLIVVEEVDMRQILKSVFQAMPVEMKSRRELVEFGMERNHRDARVPLFGIETVSKEKHAKIAMQLAEMCPQEPLEYIAAVRFEVRVIANV